MPNFGTDGPSSATYSLVLTGSNVASGLFALGVNGAQGASIVLNKVGNDILGQVGAVTYFTISVDGNGVVTFTQSLNIWHANTGSDDDASTLTLSDPALLQLTVTDADGDTASAALNLGGGVFQIEDDGPTASLALQAWRDGRVDESLGQNGTPDDGRRRIRAWPGDGSWCDAGQHARRRRARTTKVRRRSCRWRLSAPAPIPGCRRRTTGRSRCSTERRDRR